MNLSPEYLAVLANSTIRMTTPILLVTLAAALCTRVKLFNIALEGAMIAGAFFSIVANYYTGSIWLSVMAGAVSGMAVCGLVGFCVVHLKASAVVAGLAANTLMTATTTYLLSIIFNTKGVFTHPSLVSLPKITLPGVAGIPFIGTLFSGLTPLDYLAFILAGLLYVFLYKTVPGFRLRAVGINPEAARSLGTPVERWQLLTITFSGLLCGLGGCLLSMGTVTLFIQNITSGRGYIALAANTLGQSHPLGVLLSCGFFGFSQAVGNALQNTALKTQMTFSIPYAATIVALIAFHLYTQHKKKKAKEASLQ
ncbi:ABC transporter permease [Anoxynatronum sibiricum]|uniref:ABC transporter permease n=1 Tax=Anoxynatronum sibiricum TaxID=210623 RepID=A0ABU9VVF0_9CLOT